MVKGIKFGSNLSVSHLLLMDNIMAFGSTSFEEWSFYFELINNFCHVSGLTINLQKSKLLENEIENAEKKTVISLFR